MTKDGRISVRNGGSPASGHRAAVSRWGACVCKRRLQLAVQDPFRARALERAGGELPRELCGSNVTPREGQSAQQGCEEGLEEFCKVANTHLAEFELLHVAPVLLRRGSDVGQSSRVL